MLIMLIKMSTFSLLSHAELSHCTTRLFGVDVYLQCPHKEPMAFYHACGFQQCNLQDATGIELLPQTISNTLLDDTAGGFAWIVPESEDHCIIPLMRLRSGYFLKGAVEDVQSEKHIVDATNESSAAEAVQSKKKIVSGTRGGSPSLPNSAVVVDVDSNNKIISAAKGGRISGAFQWCRYPPSPFNIDKASATVLLTNTDLEEAFVGLDSLSNLLPPPFGVLVLPDKMRGRGNMGSDQRLSHSKSGGTSWMEKGALQMMTALLRIGDSRGKPVPTVA
jgi:hypothetical protein